MEGPQDKWHSVRRALWAMSMVVVVAVVLMRMAKRDFGQVAGL